VAETWLEFRTRCVATALKIQETKDDGVYAKLYAKDVTRLLATIESLELYEEPADAFEATREE